MKRKMIDMAMMVSIIFLMFSSLAFASEYQEDEVIVRFKPSVEGSISVNNSIHAEIGATIEKKFKSVDGMQLLKIGKDISVEEALRYYRQDSNVMYAEPNYKIYANDDILGQVEGMENIKSDEAIPYSETEPNDDIDNANLVAADYSGDDDYDVSGTISYNCTDKDYYQLEITTTGSLKVYGIWNLNYKDDEREEDLAMELLDEDGNAIAFSDLYDTDGDVFRYLQMDTQPGTYYIVISQSSDDEECVYIGEQYLLNISYEADVVPQFSNLWGLENTGQTIREKTGLEGADISALDAWEIETGSSDVIVAVIDTGVDYNSIELAGNMWTDEDGYHGKNFVDDSNYPLDDNGHGTHVSGTIAAIAANGTGINGVMWDADIMALKILDQDGSGSISDAISAVEFANANGAKVINMSCGGGDYSEAFYDALAASEAVIVAAAGNDASDNDSSPQYPANYELENIISVAASDNLDTLSYFSNYGAESVDVAAPGESIYSTWLNDRYVYASGTSMATPHVSGLAGLVFSEDQSLSNIEVVKLIKDNVDYIEGLDGKIVTSGRINAKVTLEEAVKYSAIEYSIEGVVIDKEMEILEMYMVDFTNARASDEFVFDDDGSLIIPSYIKSSDGCYYELGAFTSARAASDGTLSGGLKLLHSNPQFIENISPNQVKYVDGEYIISY